ncbi:hypothetical protein ANN_03539 [Periplaneta americana]|uniref:Uncharacterized protein n=1 Tax=Periplaneta americana TaxID=6978 RepID=A0ABQ8U4T9_PERAM|nr:hypothetical protein ANN_03539 [Periplaneta americana]
MGQELRMAENGTTQHVTSAIFPLRQRQDTRTSRFWVVSLSTLSSQWHLLPLRLRVVPLPKQMWRQQSANHSCQLSRPQIVAKVLEPDKLDENRERILNNVKTPSIISRADNRICKLINADSDGNNRTSPALPSSALSTETWTVQQIKPDDCRKRANFCDEMIRHIDENPRAKAWSLRRSEEKRLEAFGMWIWRRMEHVKWTDRTRNKTVMERKRAKTAQLLAFTEEPAETVGEIGIRRN